MPSGALRFVGRPALALVAVATGLVGCASPPQAQPGEPTPARTVAARVASAPVLVASLPTPPPPPMPKAAPAHRVAADLGQAPPGAALRPVLRGHGHDGAGCKS
jgi:hypothetical protein